MGKPKVDELYPWSAEYVVAHALWQKSRGRRPSMPYRGVKNPIKALALAKRMIVDTEFEDLIVVDVDERSFRRSDGWSFSSSSEWGVDIKPGDVARFYGRGIGFSIRGLDINGVECFYLTVEQQEEAHAKWVSENKAKRRAEFEKNTAALDEKYNNLPEIFQKRLDRFRTNNPDFRWEYEAYELFCCEQAVVIATAISKQLMNEASNQEISEENTRQFVVDALPNAISEFNRKSFDEQKVIVPDLSEEHSGNTFGCALKLAYLYLSEEPENVAKLHGALAPLVGSKRYGCVPVDPDVEE